MCIRDRDKVYLSTKYPSEEASGDDLERKLETSLKKLDTDYIDSVSYTHLSACCLNGWLFGRMLRCG